MHDTPFGGAVPKPEGATVISHDALVKCAERELALRKNVYPRWVGAKRMTQFKADDEIRLMQGIVDFLKTHRVSS